MTVLLGVWSRVAGAAVVVVAAVSVGTVSSVTAAAARARPAIEPAGSVGRALIQAFEAGRHMPGEAVGGIRAGSLHVGSAGRTRWALASFVPAAQAGKRLAAGFQDGAGTGLFEWRAGAWHLVRTGPYGCAVGLPAALHRDWGLARPANCAATGPAQRTAAHRALAGPAAPSASAAGLGQRIAAIALSQVGVSDTPAVASFAGVDCDPYSTLVAGFSANSDGCGYDQGFQVENENEPWCSDFAKWVWQRAGVTADMNTLNAGSVSFYDWGLGQGETMPVDGGTPAVGDAIVFFPPGTVTATGYADHVGIVTAVNADGTIDMVNGDFLGASNISAQYNTGISLPNWSASIWGTGEQWVIVSPPSAAQQPAPTVSMAGPRAAVTGTVGTFRAQGREPGGSISEYYWTFGDGRTTNTAGPDVSHVFSEAGRYTVTVTVTSSFGTATTRTWDVGVLGASGAVAAVPSDAVWFATTPVNEYLFRPSAGGLAAETWDGASWLQLAVPGQPAAGGGLAALSYPDPAAADAMTPHAYFRTASGGLAQTYLGGSGWVSQPLPGQPAAGSAIVAASTASGDPAVFFTDTGGHLAESAEQASGWVTSTLPGAPAASPGSIALAATARGLRIFSAGRTGTLTVTTQAGTGWRATPLPARMAPGSWLTAVTTPWGQARVIFRSSHGTLADLTETGTGQWRPGQLPGAPAPGSALAATNYLPAGTGASPSPAAGQTGPLGEEVFYLTAAGQPAVSYSAGQGWQTAALPAAAGASIIGADAYPVAGQPSQLFLSGPGGALLADSSSSGPAGPWTTASLPTTPATFADRVVLYAATPADQASALGAAQAAGLPASQVTVSYATAWDDTLSGNYLVISVGQAATDALYYNVCGWANPSGDIPGSTPFYIVSSPRDTLPGAGGYEAAAARTTSQTPQLAADLAYYAVHGALPPGVTALPAAAGPQYTCAGSPS
ncbi:MAG TPA: PKD domain-containing protein [Streptosporangiaceae bacterium]